DIGTGGGFPGIPLAILFPDVSFTLVDSIGKKIQVVKAVAEKLELHNVKAFHQRAEQTEGQFDFIVSRAVAPMKDLVGWTGNKLIKGKGKNSIANGFLFLKGGDLEEETREFLSSFPHYRVKEQPINAYFQEEFFQTKKIIYVYYK